MHAGGRRLPIDPQAAVDSLYNMSTHIHGFTNAVHESLKGYSYNTYNASSAQVKVKVHRRRPNRSNPRSAHRRAVTAGRPGRVRSSERVSRTAPPARRGDDPMHAHAAGLQLRSDSGHHAHAQRERDDHGRHGHHHPPLLHPGHRRLAAGPRHDRNMDRPRLEKKPSVFPGK